MEKFKWLNSYRRDDQTAIDRNIADGKVALKKRESKFREELEQREHEYIIFKDFLYVSMTMKFFSFFFRLRLDHSIFKIKFNLFLI